MSNKLNILLYYFRVCVIIIFPCDAMDYQNHIIGLSINKAIHRLDNCADSSCAMNINTICMHALELK